MLVFILYGFIALCVAEGLLIAVVSMRYKDEVGRWPYARSRPTMRRVNGIED